MKVWQIAKELGEQNLTPLEFYFALEGLAWFVGKDKLPPPTAEELALGARNYVKMFQESGLLPFFIGKNRFHKIFFWICVWACITQKIYLPRTI